MIEVLVFVRRDASLARYEAIAGELEAAGLELRARYATVGVIVGRAADRALLARLQTIQDVTGVHDQSGPPPPPEA